MAGRATADLGGEPEALPDVDRSTLFRAVAEDIEAGAGALKLEIVGPGDSRIGPPGEHLLRALPGLVNALGDGCAPRRGVRAGCRHRKAWPRWGGGLADRSERQHGVQPRQSRRGHDRDRMINRKKGGRKKRKEKEGKMRMPRIITHPPPPPTGEREKRRRGLKPRILGYLCVCVCVFNKTHGAAYTVYRVT